MSSNANNDVPSNDPVVSTDQPASSESGKSPLKLEPASMQKKDVPDSKTKTNGEVLQGTRSNPGREASLGKSSGNETSGLLREPTRKLVEKTKLADLFGTRNKHALKDKKQSSTFGPGQSSAPDLVCDNKTDQNSDCPASNALRQLSKKTKAQNFHSRKKKKGGNVKDIVPSGFNKNIDKLIRPKREIQESAKDDMLKTEKDIELKKDVAESDNTNILNSEPQESCQPLGPRQPLQQQPSSLESQQQQPSSLESQEQQQPSSLESQQQPPLESQEKEFTKNNEESAQEKRFHHDPNDPKVEPNTTNSDKTQSNNLNKLLFAHHKTCDDCDKEGRDLFQLFEKDKTIKPVPVVPVPDIDPFVEKLDVLRTKQVREATSAASDEFFKPTLEEKRSLAQSFNPSSDISGRNINPRAKQGLEQSSVPNPSESNISGAQGQQNKPRDKVEQQTLVKKRPALGPKTSLSKPDDKRPALLPNPQVAKPPIGPFIPGSEQRSIPLASSSNDLNGPIPFQQSQQQGQVSQIRREPLGPKPQGQLPSQIASGPNTSLSNQQTSLTQPQRTFDARKIQTSNSDNDTDSSITSFDLSEESTSVDGSSSRDDAKYKKPNVRFKKPPKGFNKQATENYFRLFKQTVLKNNVVEQIATDQDYVDAVSKFLITQLGKKDLITSVWESTWSNAYDKAQKVCTDTDFDPFFWFHFFSMVMLNFQIKNNKARFNKDSSCKLESFLIYGNLLKHHFGITQKYWFPLFLFHNFPAEKIREILSSEIWLEKLKICTRRDRDQLIDVVTNVKFEDSSALKHEWGNIVAQISVKVPQNFKEMNDQFDEVAKKQCCTPEKRDIIVAKEKTVSTEQKNLGLEKNPVPLGPKISGSGQSSIPKNTPNDVIQPTPLAAFENTLKTVVDTNVVKKKIKDGQCKVKNMRSHERRAKLVGGSGNMLTKCATTEEIDPNLKERGDRCIETTNATFIEPLPRSTKTKTLRSNQRQQSNNGERVSVPQREAPGFATGDIPRCKTQTITFIPQQQQQQRQQSVCRPSTGTNGFNLKNVPPTLTPVMPEIYYPQRQIPVCDSRGVQGQGFAYPTTSMQHFVQSQQYVGETIEDREQNTNYKTEGPFETNDKEMPALKEESIDDGSQRKEMALKKINSGGNKINREIQKYIKTEHRNNDNSHELISKYNDNNCENQMSDSKLASIVKNNSFTKQLIDEVEKLDEIQTFCNSVGVKKITELQSKSKLKFIAHVVEPNKIMQTLSEQYRNVDVLPVQKIVEYTKEQRTQPQNNDNSVQNTVVSERDGILPFQSFDEWRHYLNVFAMLEKNDKELQTLDGFEPIEQFYQKIIKDMPSNLFDWSNYEKLQHYLAIYVGSSTSQEWQQYWKTQWTLNPVVCEKIKQFKKEQPAIPDIVEHMLVSLFPSKVEK